MQNTIKQVRKLLALCKNRTEFFALDRRQCFSNIHEPPYLEGMKSKIPLYDTINIQLKGYDYPVLESYQKFMHNTLKNIDVDVEDCWALPPQHTQIVRYKPKSSVVDSEYKLKLYERNIQITDVTSTQYAIILRLLEASLPEGVTLNVHQHEDWYEEIRYVPDKELISLKSQLDEIAAAKKK